MLKTSCEADDLYSVLSCIAVVNVKVSRSAIGPVGIIAVAWSRVMMQFVFKVSI